MLYEDLKNDHVIDDWLNSTTQKPNTRRLYLFSMQWYTEFLQMTPEDILLEAEEDIRNGVLPRQSKLKRHLLDYKAYLYKRELAPLTIKTRMTGVYSFYKKNDITLPSLPNNESKSRPLKQHKDIPTKEDLQTVLKHCDELERALILIGVSGGLSSQEICNLTIDDFKKGYDPVTEVTTLKLRREKVDYDFVTFLTPEASRAVLTYLEFREKKPTRNTQRKQDKYLKQKIYDKSNFLLIGRRIPQKYLKKMDESMRKLDDGAVVSIYQEISEASQKTTPSGVWSVIRSHNMRKYFSSVLLNNGADSQMVNFWMGHTLDQTQSAYFIASVDGGLRDTYMKFIPYLTIEKKADVSESPEYLRIKQENQILQVETARHVVERSELQDLRVEMEAIKKSEEERRMIERENSEMQIAFGDLTKNRTFQEMLKEAVKIEMEKLNNQSKK
jgi:integrase